MHEPEVQNLSGKKVFQRGILRENPVLMQCIGLFPAIALATSLKAAAIVAVASAVLLIVMEFLTALLLKKLPFWLRIGIYALLSFGLLAGGLVVCERFLPDFLGTLGGYLPLLAVNAIIVFRCETCAARQTLRVSLLDALGASLGYAIVLVLLGFVRELLGSGAILGHTISSLPEIPGMLMPFGGFLLLGFMAAAVKGVYHFRHRGEDELATPIAHVDEDDVSVVEPLVRRFRKDRSGMQGVSAPKAVKQPKQKKHTEKAAEETTQSAIRVRKTVEKQTHEEKRQAIENKRFEPEKKQQAPEKKRKALDEGKHFARKPAEKESTQKADSPVSPPTPARMARQDDELESFADVLAALNRRRAEQERKAQETDGHREEEKGEKRQ